MKRRIRRTHVALATGVSLALFGGALQLASWSSSPLSNLLSIEASQLYAPTGLTNTSGTLSWAGVNSFVDPSGATISPSYNVNGYGPSGWSTLTSTSSTSNTPPIHPAIYACYGVQSKVGSWTSPYSTAVPSGVSKGYPFRFGAPFAIAIATNGDAYVANYNPGSVAVISTTNNSYVTTITNSEFIYPGGIAIASNGDAYVTNFYGNSVAVISTTNNSYVTTITNSGLYTPYNIAIAPNGDAYVANQSGNSVSVIDTTNNSYVTTITNSVLNYPTSIAIAPNGDAYVTNRSGGSIFIISTTNNSYLGTVTLAGVSSLQNVAFVPGTNYGYVLSNTHLSPIGPCW